MCESPATYMMRVRRARKEHRCCECGGKILKGESYNYHSGVWDGQGRSFKVCPECDLLRADLDFDAHGDDAVPFTEICERVKDLGDPATTDRLLNIMRKRSAKIPEYLTAEIEDD